MQRADLRFEPKIASILRSISQVAEAQNVPCFVVGGTVRDTILGRPVLDLDLLIDTTNPPGISADQFAKIASGRLHGSHPVCFDRFGTLHFLVGTGGDTTQVEIVGAALHVSDDYAIGDTSDITRRDFTANALLVGLNASNQGRLYDLTGRGIDDIKKRILRCPLDPRITLADDPIRMLRAVRLSCSLAFQVHDSVRDYIAQNPRLVEGAAVERIAKELQLTILSDRPKQGFELLHELNLLRVVMPEIESLGGIMQDKRFHSQDVLHHTFSVLGNLHRKDLATRLAALFHDAGKPQAKMLKDNRVVFYGHEHIGAEIASRRLRALHFPNKLINEVASLVRNHMINYSEEWTDAAIRRLIKRLGQSLQKQLDLYEADIGALTGSQKLLDSARELRRRIETIDEKEQVSRIRAPLDGHEICALLGIEPGPLVGKYKAKLLDAVLTGQIPNDKDAAKKFLLDLSKDENLSAEAPSSGDRRHKTE